MIVDSPSDSSLVMSLVGAWDLPKLNTLAIEGHEVRHIDLILRNHGVKLRTLSLNIVITDSSLAQGLAYCSNLQQLVLSLYLEVPCRIFQVLESSLLRVGIEDLDELADMELRKSFGDLNARLDRFLSVFLGNEFRKLRSVTAVKTTPQQMRAVVKLSSDEWRKWYCRFRARRVRMEDGWGNVLVC